MKSMLKPAKIANIKYNVPISLAFVENNHRIILNALTLRVTYCHLPCHFMV